MADYRLKIKIGDHEFEAEGPADDVREQFAAFKELIGSARIQKPADVKTPQDAPEGAAINGGSLAIEKIMRAEGRVVSLTVRPGSIPDAVILLLLGQRQFRGNDGVTGAEILDGLQESGQVTNRVDHTMNRLAEEGLVIAIGMNRAKRYRLSNAGLSKAQELSRNFIATVP